MKKKISDKERLDWMSCPYSWFRSVYFTPGIRVWRIEMTETLFSQGPTLRQAIDSAMRKEKE